MIDLVKEVFNDYYLMVFGDEYSFGNKRIEDQLTSFVDRMPQSADKEWLYAFIGFQFSHYVSLKTRFDRIYVNWIFGEKALQRWATRTPEKAYYAEKLRKRLNVRFDSDVEALPRKEYENVERNRYSDPILQLFHCDVMALFDMADSSCLRCKMYDKCKEHSLLEVREEADCEC